MANRDPFELCGKTVDGKYRVLSVVGEGGFGVVYKAVHEGFEAPVAVKCLKLPPHFDSAMQEVLVQQLREEGRTLLRLSQRTSGILQALDVGAYTTASGARVPYLVLEWLEGRTLAEERHGQPGLSLRDAFERLDPAARALAVAHEEKVAHRDIKPENLFCITSGGKPTLKVLDFGIAKLLGDAATPNSGTVMGAMSMFTPNYAAPEQFDKKRGATGPWTDVFAFALVFVELASAQAGLQGTTVFELFNASSDPVARPTLRARGVVAPDPVERVIEKAVHPQAAERYRDMGSFWKALGDAMREAGIASLPPFAPGSAPPDDLANASTIAVLPGTSPGGAPTGPVTGAGPRSSVGPENAPTIQQGPTTGPSQGGTTVPATRVEAATTAPSATAPPQRGAGTWIALGAAVLLGAGGSTLGWRALHTGSHHDPAAASASASAEAPISTNAKAAGLYKDAMQSWHDGAFGPAIRFMEQALAKDPELAAGELRLALWSFTASPGKPIEGRAHYNAARLRRSGLSEVDKELLEASEPCARQPRDLDEWSKRLDALTRKFPDSTELLVHLGLSYHARFQADLAIATFERALQKDPTLMAARAAEAESLSVKGDVDGQLKAYKSCLETSPQATQCLLRQLVVRAQSGACAEIKGDAKRLADLDPESATSQRQLALALNGTGASPESVLDVLTRSWAHETPADKKWAEPRDRAAIAALAGNFAEAERRLVEWQGAIADKTDQASHAEPAQHLAELYTEMGQPKKASDVADAFILLMPGRVEPPIGNYGMRFLAYKLRAGAVSREDYDKHRAEALEKLQTSWKGAGRTLDDDFAWVAWTLLYGMEVETEPEAKVALAAMPKRRSRLMDSGRFAMGDLAQGRVYALVGPAAQAVAPLRRAASPCLALADPVETTWANLYLGMALEATEPDGARAAYHKVLDHWGKAPHSITADQAKKRLAALGDKKN